jgi:hypothetical protein
LAYLGNLNPYEYRKTEDRQALLYSVGMALLGVQLSKTASATLNEYEAELFPVPQVPEDSFDLLGTIYQYLNSKQENLEKGSFYTGPRMADDFVQDLDFAFGQRIIDPACGSGMFLFRSNASPDQIFGLDSDPLAIMIAKFNYFLKFPEAAAPNLFCVDFFDWLSRNGDLEFDYLIANPPYGANVELPSYFDSKVKSGETFSYFIEFGMRLVNEAGLARFLVPDALLNVKRHSDIRTMLLDEFDLRRVRRYDSRFSGLMSDVYQLEIGHGQTSSVLMEGKMNSRISKPFIKSFKNSIFPFLGQEDIRLIAHAQELGSSSLSGCEFGLGVVTGDNRTVLREVCGAGQEPIFTGKEITPYRLLDPRWFISFDRDTLQQVAPDEIYRAPVKLLYKAISRKLTVAIDRTGSLTTNSANIIIPDEELMSPESLAAILNSTFMSFLYIKMFGNVNKIGKEHLLHLPIPPISIEQDRWLTEHVNSIQGLAECALVDDFVALEVFGLESSQLHYLRSEL